MEGNELEFSDRGKGKTARYFEQGDEPSGFIIFAVFLGYLRNCWLVKKNFASWSHLVSWLVVG
jgi:hypothetical protein